MKNLKAIVIFIVLCGIAALAAWLIVYHIKMFTIVFGIFTVAVLLYSLWQFAKMLANNE
jgi:uncharacterized membrane protein YfcA